MYAFSNTYKDKLVQLGFGSSGSINFISNLEKFKEYVGLGDKK